MRIGTNLSLIKSASFDHRYTTLRRDWKRPLIIENYARFGHVTGTGGAFRMRIARANQLSCSTSAVRSIVMNTGVR